MQAVPCRESSRSVRIPKESDHPFQAEADHLATFRRKLDDGSAFTGDLTHPALIGEDDAAVVSASWRLLRERGATRVYPLPAPESGTSRSEASVAV